MKIRDYFTNFLCFKESLVFHCFLTTENLINGKYLSSNHILSIIFSKNYNLTKFYSSEDSNFYSYPNYYQVSPITHSLEVAFCNFVMVLLPWCDVSCYVLKTLLSPSICALKVTPSVIIIGVTEVLDAICEQQLLSLLTFVTFLGIPDNLVLS